MSDHIALYQQSLNIQGAAFSRIDHDDAMVAVAYKIVKQDSMKLALKICSRTGDYLRETYFLHHFAGKVPVPRIIQLVPPEKDIDRAILMEYLPGSLLKTSDFTGELAYGIGSQLARIHLNCTEGYGDLTRPNEFNQDPRAHFTAKFEERLNV
jgi:tRNA A-37 threonylcarbamoyl transferase component Bud32